MTLWASLLLVAYWWAAGGGFQALGGWETGLVSAGLATTLYGLHCPEYAAAFVVLWYSLGIALSVGAGALIGKVAFRW